MKPRIEVLNLLQRLITAFGNFVLRLEIHLDRLREVSRICGFQPGP
jgi:hypothetical protein